MAVACRLHILRSLWDSSHQASCLDLAIQYKENMDCTDKTITVMPCSHGATCSCSPVQPSSWAKGCNHAIPSLQRSSAPGQLLHLATASYLTNSSTWSAQWHTGAHLLVCTGRAQAGPTSQGDLKTLLLISQGIDVLSDLPCPHSVMAAQCAAVAADSTETSLTGGTKTSLHSQTCMPARLTRPRIKTPQMQCFSCRPACQTPLTTPGLTA